MFNFINKKKRGDQTAAKWRKNINFSCGIKINERKKRINEANKGDDSMCFVSMAWYNSAQEKKDTTSKKKRIKWFFDAESQGLMSV